MSKYAINNIISITFKNPKTGESIVWEDIHTVSEEEMTISNPTFYGKPKIGDHVYLTGIGSSHGITGTFEIDGFYGGPVINKEGE